MWNLPRTGIKLVSLTRTSRSILNHWTTREILCFLFKTAGKVRVSLVAQLVKNPPAMWETWVRSLGWEDPLEKGKATHSSILAWRITWTV